MPLLYQLLPHTNHNAPRGLVCRNPPVFGFSNSLTSRNTVSATARRRWSPPPLDRALVPLSADRDSGPIALVSLPRPSHHLEYRTQGLWGSVDGVGWWKGVLIGVINSINIVCCQGVIIKGGVDRVIKIPCVARRVARRVWWSKGELIKVIKIACVARRVWWWSPRYARLPL